MRYKYIFYICILEDDIPEGLNDYFIIFFRSNVEIDSYTTKMNQEEGQCTLVEGKTLDGVPRWKVRLWMVYPGGR